MGDQDQEFPALMDNPPEPRKLSPTYEEAEAEKQKKEDENDVVVKKPIRNRYSREQMIWAVRQLRTGKPAQDIAKELGPYCSDQTIYRWRRHSWRWKKADMEAEAKIKNESENMNNKHEHCPLDNDD